MNAADLQQKLASDPTVSVWVGANAGTGKTKVLTDRLLRLLLNDAAPDRILCLTYTRAGAAEMRARLEQQLAAFVVMDDETLVKELTALLGPEQSPQIAKHKARRLFAEVIDSPTGGIRIGTLHSFCQSMLQRFPLEAGIAPNFALASDIEAMILQRGVRDSLLAENNTAIAVAMRQVIGETNEDRLDRLLAQARQHRESIENFGPDAAQALAEALDLEQGATPQSVLEQASEESVFDRSVLLRIADIMAAGSGVTDKKRGQNIHDWLAAPDTADRVAGFTAYAAAYLTQEGEPFKTPATKGTISALEKAGLMDALLNEITRVGWAMVRARRAGVLTNTIAFLTIAREFLKRYDQAKTARGLLDYDDLIRYAVRLVGRRETVSWVLYKLDQGLDHLLIDEAQDTNPAQWTLVEALTAEFFGGEARVPLDKHGNPARTLFVVGDYKQSIYAFQGADPESYRAARARIAARLRPFAAPGSQGPSCWRDLPLITSFRSVPAVLQAVDLAFADGPTRQGVAASSADVIRHDASERRARDGGETVLWPPVILPEIEVPNDWLPPAERPGGMTAPIVLADRIVETVSGWLASGERLDSAARPLRPGDILILVQRRDARVAAMIAGFKARGIAVAGADRLKLLDALVVQDLLALGHVLLLPSDDYSLACVLKSPLIGLTEDQLMSLAIGRGRQSLWQALRSAAAYMAIADWLERLIATAETRPVYELFAEILVASCPGDPTGSGRRAFQARLGPDCLDALDVFLSAALSAQASGTPVLARFLREIETGETEVKRLAEGGEDAIRIMTVHGAKGLQAPLVILADAQYRPGAGKLTGFLPLGAGLPPVWLPSTTRWQGVLADAVDAAITGQTNDYHRLLYVALTRAADRLYIAGHGMGKKQTVPENSWHGMLSAAWETSPLFAKHETPFGSGHRLHRPQDHPPIIHPPKPPVTRPNLPPGLRQLPPPPDDPPRPLAPSRPEAEEAPALSPRQSDDPGRFKRGLLVHRLLQSLPELQPDARAETAARYLAAAAPEWPDARRAKLVAEVLAVLTAPNLADLFGPGSRAEVPLTARIGNTIISARIDRLLVTPDRILIADFKTARPVPASPSDIDPANRAQMQAYADAIALLYPGRPIASWLIFTDGPKVLAVT